MTEANKNTRENKMEKGLIVVEKVQDRSTITRCYSKYPLKFITPRKVGPSKIDVVWVYILTYGGGIVSGDCIACEINVGDGCTAVLTTQASTKVYKSLGLQCSEQILEAKIGSTALLAIIPDPVTCFLTARYSQKQVFRMASDSNLVLVDWVTSGRHESGEEWDFELYKSTNQIYLEGNEPLFLDTVLLEKGNVVTVAERMQGYRVVAMIILLGPKLKRIQVEVQENVKRMMSEQLRIPSNGFKGSNSNQCWSKPIIVASCSPFGAKGTGMVVRIAAVTTESVYKFLQNQLAGLETMLGVSPYS